MTPHSALTRQKSPSNSSTRTRENGWIQGRGCCWHPILGRRPVGENGGGVGGVAWGITTLEDRDKDHKGRAGQPHPAPGTATVPPVLTSGRSPSPSHLRSQQRILLPHNYQLPAVHMLLALCIRQMLWVSTRKYVMRPLCWNHALQKSVYHNWTAACWSHAVEYCLKRSRKDRYIQV